VNFNKEKSVFLLGGHDLEMVTIKEILIEEGFEEGVDLFDKGLSWNEARLSAYKGEIEHCKDKTIYAVELFLDDNQLQTNRKILLIDHHNEHHTKEASLLQVLKLLGKEPSREQKLIAANDSTYIEGMQCLGASNDEIGEIRKKDRKLQGVTKRDEIAAKNDLRSKQNFGNVVTVCATTPFFSAITDAYYMNEPNTKMLIVYNDVQTVFYGFPLTEMKTILKKLKIDEKHYYYGGGEYGYVGIKEGCLSVKSLSVVREYVIDAFKDELCSYHAFMYPFSFDKVSLKEEAMEDVLSLHERITIDKKMVSALEESGWHYEAFRLNDRNDTRIYNEYVYYSEPVRQTLYNFQENFEEGETSYYFSRDVEEGSRFSITIKNGLNETQTYDLQLTDVYLRLFETGVGVLVFEVENHHYPDFEDILKINEYARRVYPQFLDKGCEDYATAVKHTFLPDSVTVEICQSQSPILSVTEKFESYHKGFPDDIRIGMHITEVLGKTPFCTDKSQGKYRIRPVLDDRMFVVSYAENPALFQCMKEDDEAYKSNDKWYEYLFVDGKGKTVQYAPMQRALTEASTYPRWLGWGTLWGITRYSLVALTTRGGRDLILPHTQYHYHQMAILILAIRASLARFSNEVSELSNLKKKDEHFAQKVQMLYEYYIKFVNKLYFRELTSQDQGIELYNMAKKILDFDAQIKSLDEEIAELHTYVAMVQEKQRNDRLETISKLGAVFLPPALLSGIFGMNSVTYLNNGIAVMLSLFAVFFSGLLGWVMVSKKDQKKQTRTYIFSAVMLLIVMFGIPGYLHYQKAQEISKKKTKDSSITVIKQVENDKDASKGEKE